MSLIQLITDAFDELFCAMWVIALFIIPLGAWNAVRAVKKYKNDQLDQQKLQSKVKELQDQLDETKRVDGDKSDN